MPVPRVIGTDATATHSASQGAVVRHTGILTTNRVMGLNTGFKGAEVKVARTGSGAFNLNVMKFDGATVLKALATNSWASSAMTEPTSI